MAKAIITGKKKKNLNCSKTEAVDLPQHYKTLIAKKKGRKFANFPTKRKEVTEQTIGLTARGSQETYNCDVSF